MRITKWGEYGILCSLFLASKEEEANKEQGGVSVSASDIAEVQSIPLQYTHQILQRLRKGDIIQSVRGPKGGYKLSRAPEEINLKQVLEASEGTTFDVICDTNPIYGDSCGTEQACALSGVWRDLKEAIDNVLRERTLASLLVTHEFFPGKVKTEELVNI